MVWCDVECVVSVRCVGCVNQVRLHIIDNSNIVTNPPRCLCIATPAPR